MCKWGSLIDSGTRGDPFAQYRCPGWGCWPTNLAKWMGKRGAKPLPLPSPIWLDVAFVAQARGPGTPHPLSHTHPQITQTAQRWGLLSEAGMGSWGLRRTAGSSAEQRVPAVPVALGPARHPPQLLLVPVGSSPQCVACLGPAMLSFPGRVLPPHPAAFALWLGSARPPRCSLGSAPQSWPWLPPSSAWFCANAPTGKAVPVLPSLNKSGPRGCVPCHRPWRQVQSGSPLWPSGAGRKAGTACGALLARASLTSLFA